MDVKLASRIAPLGVAALALAAWFGPVAAADDASSIAFVTATDAVTSDAVSSDRALPPVAEPAEPTQSVIQIADDSAPASRRQTAPAARGELTVVANSASAPPITVAPVVVVPPVAAAPATAMIADDQVLPAGSIEGVEGSRSGAGMNWCNVLASGPRRPGPGAGIQSANQRGSRYSTPTTAHAGAASPPPAPRYAVEPALNDAPLPYDLSAPARPTSTGPTQPASIASRTAAPSAGPLVKSPAEHSKELLVNAYQLSLTAANEAEFSQIVQWCTTAARTPLDNESRQFGANLSAWALNRRGQLRADQGQSDHALADFRAALEFAPDNWRALHNKAVTLAQSGQFAEAFDDLCHVIQVKPDFAKAYSNRATLYVQAGDYEHALADYDAAIAADPKQLPALVGRGRVCHMQGKLAQALVSIDAAVKLAANDADIVCSRADLLADLGRYDDALADYARAIDLNSKFEHAYRNGAWLLATCPEETIRDADGALAGAQAALDCGYGERHAALDTMAAALANAGRFEEAVGTIQQAIEIAPEESRAAYQARQQLYESGQAFRTHPVGAKSVSTAKATESTQGEQEAVYIEE